MATRMKDFTGSVLTNGSFLQMSNELYKLILKTTPAALKLETLAPQYAAVIARLTPLVSRQTGYAETADVRRTDTNRDALWRSLYYTLHYLNQLDPSHALYTHVQRLLPVFSPYKGMQEHELSKETTEIDNFLTAIDTDANAAAIEALGLAPIIGALATENDKLKTSATTRTASAATRAAATGTESTDRVRAEVVTVYHNVVARVNAVAELESTPEVVQFISDANAVADHYNTIAANQGKKQQPKAGEAGAVTEAAAGANVEAEAPMPADDANEL